MGVDVRLVSISVDPSHDSPETLRTYADRYGAHGDRWLFLTGSVDAVYALVRNGFKLVVSEQLPDAPPYADGPILHSDRFVVLDSENRIRGYFRPTEEGGMDELVAVLRQLAK
jgi:protein SCO1/2